MPKLNKFKVTVETGDKGTEGPIHFCINNHKVPFEEVKGSTAPGETFEGEFEVNSFAHSLTLVGPEKGEWEIKKMKVDFEPDLNEPYAVTFGAVTLDETTEVNIWKDPPLPVFDV
ncbi:MAG: helicase [Candidatus Nitrohelix vancouverensis]|uniref:Helicase n=1 Tax=Candidatus Nitrohelix vancouverensis TaxID=2705534 RepID=A0A7T0C3A6_9BACT|nr:MAG: helicase [Candidatus Nitrohelix vancouverensis]